MLKWSFYFICDMPLQRELVIMKQMLPIACASRCVCVCVHLLLNFFKQHHLRSCVRVYV